MVIDSTQIQMKNGKCEAYVLHPESSGPLPGVLFFIDAIGVREASLSVAQTLAEQGFLVLVPNIFYREGRLPSIPNLPSKMTLDNYRGIYPVIHHMISSFTPDLQVEDTHEYLDFLQSHPKVLKGKIGCVGFCFGGGMSLRTAACFADRVAAAATIHGGKLAKDVPESPLHVVHKIKAHLYLGHAHKDVSMSKEDIDLLDRTLNEAGVKHETEILVGAHHGYAMPDTPAFNEKARDHAMKKVARLFRERLISPSPQQQPSIF